MGIHIHNCLVQARSRV